MFSTEWEIAFWIRFGIGKSFLPGSTNIWLEEFDQIKTTLLRVSSHLQCSTISPKRSIGSRDFDFITLIICYSRDGAKFVGQLLPVAPCMDNVHPSEAYPHSEWWCASPVSHIAVLGEALKSRESLKTRTNSHKKKLFFHSYKIFLASTKWDHFLKPR